MEKENNDCITWQKSCEHTTNQNPVFSKKEKKTGNEIIITRCMICGRINFNIKINEQKRNKESNQN